MFSIRWKDTKSSPSVKEYFESKLSKIYRFKNVDKESIKAEIVYYSRENEFSVRLNVNIIKSHTIRSEHKAPDVLTAINKVVDHCLDQIRRIKTKKDVKRK
ncbi:HPF/RaiA family ribosome-associated protein [Mycoplasmoides pirum]|uniref:HPF/RaiA family ribosome-associated protein n=1 Tax=Mycoplasmoides pirum TaxID=2122 RepID=UPI000487944B|nr:HPF/RaiA family ribosome-associated protein [Mycoplasmoides pirum]